MAIAFQENRHELVVSNQEGVDPLLYCLKQLNFLEISKCGLTELSEDVSNLEELTKLSLQHNALLTVPNGLASLINLKYLDVSFNAISSLPANIFEKLSHLESLVLDSNQLADLPSLSGLVELHHLSAANNQLCSLPATLSNCAKLMTVNAAGNQITELPSDMSWSNLAHLHRLNLSDNRLTAIPGELAECRKLRELLLSGNPLKDNRLKKLAADTRPGPAIINYIGKIANGGSGGGRRDRSKKRGPRAASQSARRNFKQADVEEASGSRPINIADHADKEVGRAFL